MKALGVWPILIDLRKEFCKNAIIQASFLALNLLLSLRPIFLRHLAL